MEKRKFTVEEKKEFVMAYCKERRSYKGLNAEKIAAWCNETYGSEINLHGYDFRRPPAFREWLSQIKQ